MKPKMSEFILPPGIRFYPTEEELLLFYLPNKLRNARQEMDRLIPVVNIYTFDPSHLPPMSGEASTADPEQCFFFCPRQEREAQGGRPTRTTPSGYWKATGSTALVYSRSDRSAIGLKRTMVFYTGRAPTGTKTVWKMNEYRVIERVPSASPSSRRKVRNEFSLCRVYIRSGTVRSFDRRPLGVGLLPAAGDQAVGSSLGSNLSGEDADAELLKEDWDFDWTMTN